MKKFGNQLFLMIQIHWKVLKNNYVLDFWSFVKSMKKWCQNRSQKSRLFWIQNGDMCPQVSTYPLIFDFLVCCQQNGDFWTPSRWPPKSEASVKILFPDVFDVTWPLLLASGDPRAAPFSRSGSSGRRYKKTKGKERRGIEHARGQRPGEFHICLYAAEFV